MASTVAVRSKLCAGSTTPWLNCVLPFRRLESPVLHGGVLRPPGECHCHSRRVALLAMVLRDTKGRLRHCDVKFALGEAHLPKSVGGEPVEPVDGRLIFLWVLCCRFV